MKNKSKKVFALVLITILLLNMLSLGAAAAPVAESPGAQEQKTTNANNSVQAPGSPSGTENSGKGSEPFTDVKADNGNFLFIKYLSDRKLLNGFPDRTFRPAASLTRAEAAAVLVKAAGLKPGPAKTVFKDVGPKHWAAASIAAARDAGFLSGYPDGTFRPEAKITRAEGITLILKLSKQSDPGVDLPALTDMAPKHWAARPVAVGLASGMMGLASDNKRFLPDTPLTRGSLARALAFLLTRDPALYETSLAAKLHVVAGPVTVARADGKTPETINGSTDLLPGDTVNTGTSGLADISFPDGTGLRLEKNSQFIIKEARGRSYIKSDGTPGTAVEWLLVDLKSGKMFGALATAAGADNADSSGNSGSNNSSSNNSSSNNSSNTNNGGTAQAAVSQVRAMGLGSLAENRVRTAAAAAKPLAWWQQSGVKRTKVKIDMPTGVAAIRGTFWENTVNPDGSFVTTLLTGSAEITAGGQTVSLAAGQRTAVAGAGAPPAPPAPLTVEDKKAWVAQKEWAQQRAMEIKAQQEQALPPPPPAEKPNAPAPVQQQPQTPAPGQPQALVPADITSIVENALTSVGAGAADSPVNTSTTGSSSGDSSSGGTTVNNGSRINSYPANGQTGVPLYPSIVVSFDRAVTVPDNAYSITLNRLSDGSAVQCNVTVLKSAAIIEPLSSLAQGTTYSLSVPQGAVVDTNGTPVEAYNSTFTTEVHYDVAGKVYNPAGGDLTASDLSISGIEVFLYSKFGKILNVLNYVDPNSGSFQISAPEGDYYIRAVVTSPTSPFTNSFVRPIHVGPGSPGPLDLRLTTATLMGRVYQPDGSPFYSFTTETVRIVPDALTGMPDEIPLKDDGTFKYGGVPNGKYTLQFRTKHSSLQFTDSMPVSVYIDNSTVTDIGINMTNPAISGWVYAPDGTTPISSSIPVYLQRAGIWDDWYDARSTFTDSNGKFVFGGLPDGEYTLTVNSVPDYAPPQVALVNVTGGTPVVQNLTCVPNDLSVTGRVYMPDGTPFVPTSFLDVNVELEPVDSSVYRSYSGPVSNDGTFRFYGVIPGSYRIIANPRGYENIYSNSEPQIVNVVPGQVGDYGVSIRDTRVGGNIYTPDGKRYVPGFSTYSDVWLKSTTVEDIGSGSVRPDGSYFVGWVPDGQYELNLVLDSQETKYSEPDTVNVTVQGTERQTVNLTLKSPVLTGKILLPDIELVPDYVGISVELYNSDHSVEISKSVGKDGSFSFGNIPAGNYFLLADVFGGNGYAGSRPVAVQIGTTPVTQDIALTTPQIMGKVFAPDGQPAYNCDQYTVSIEVTDTNGNLVRRYMTELGTYRLGGLDPGTYYVRAVVEGNNGNTPPLWQLSDIPLVTVSDSGPAVVQNFQFVM